MSYLDDNPETCRTYIAPAWLPDGRQGWDLVAEWRDEDNAIVARRAWGPYATWERMEFNTPRFLEHAAMGPDWREYIAEAITLAGFGPAVYAAGTGVRF